MINLPKNVIKNKVFLKKGFTLVELMVTVGIFVLMTGLLLFKYNSFNGGVLLTNLAYDVALSIRQAQSAALNVQESGIGTKNFTYPYGVHLSTASGSNTSFYLFADSSGSHTPIAGESQTAGDFIFQSGSDSIINQYGLKRGSIISNICVGSNAGSCVAKDDVNIMFIRPNPDAVIRVTSDITATYYHYAVITLQANDGSTKQVIVQGSGQISVK